MNPQLPNYIEDVFQTLEAPERDHPGGVSGSNAGSGDPLNQYLQEADLIPAFDVETFRQYWASPYDNFFLVLKFPENFSFKNLDILALSPKMDLTFEDLKAAAENEDQQLILDMVQPRDLKDNTWLTSVSETNARSVKDGHLYVHYFFASRHRNGEGIWRRHSHHTVVRAPHEIPQIENPNNIGGVAKLSHPGIPSQKRPDLTMTPTTAGAVSAAQVAGGASLPYTRLFMTLAAREVTWNPLYHMNVCINVEMAPGVTPDKYDYIALADHYPQNAKDYIGHYYWQYVADLGPGGYVTNKQCVKNIDANLAVVNFEELEKLYVFYAGWVDGAWTIIGDPVSFKSQRHWMTESLVNIGQKKLHEIVIPGSHDAGSFDMYGKMFVMNGWAHNMDFSGQLELGMRYFDCRLKNYPGYDPPFYFYHGIARTWTTIADLISALKKFFIENNSTDIVILDFTHFEGLERNAQKDDFATLFNYFVSDQFFANAMVSPDEARDMTISELRSLGRRLYITCVDDPDDKARTQFNLGESISLTPQWANTPYITTLKPFLDNQVATNATSGKLWSLQTILTPRADDSLVWWAQELYYPVLSKWIVDEWWDKINIAICDFPGGTDVVHAAQGCNTLRKRSPHGYNSGDIFWYQDQGFQTGTGQLTGDIKIGQGSWTDFKSVFAGGNGRIYAIEWNGSLKRYDDTHWQQGAPMSLTSSKVISTANWQNYRQVFASMDGPIYAITGAFGNLGTGKLMRWHDTGGDSLGEGQQIDAGWEQFRFAFASSNGVIYAVTGAYMMAGTGKLWRCRVVGDKLEPGTMIDGGWENIRTAFASSDGRIYAINSNGELWRIHDTGAATLGPGTKLANWSDVRMATATSDGRLYAIRD